MRKLAVLAVAAAVFGSVGVASAAQPADKGKLEATLEANVAAGVVTYDVTRNIPKNKDAIWVTTDCDGVRVNTQIVFWGFYDSLVGHTDPLEVSGSCRGYVTIRPWQNKVLGDAEVFFQA